MVALNAVWYNFVKIHKTLKVTPAMAAGVSGELKRKPTVTSICDLACALPASAIAAEIVVAAAIANFVQMRIPTSDGVGRPPE